MAFSLLKWIWVVGLSECLTIGCNTCITDKLVFNLIDPLWVRFLVLGEFGMSVVFVVVDLMIVMIVSVISIIVPSTMPHDHDLHIHFHSSSKDKTSKLHFISLRIFFVTAPRILMKFYMNAIDAAWYDPGTSIPL